MVSCIQQEPLRGLSQGKTTATNNEVEMQSLVSQQVEYKISKIFNSVKISKEKKMYKSKESKEDMSENDQVDKGSRSEGLDDEEYSIS